MTDEPTFGELKSMEEQFGPLDEASVSLHEMFMSLTRAGFSEQNAIYLVSKMMVNGSGSSSEPDEDSES